MTNNLPENLEINGSLGQTTESQSGLQESGNYSISKPKTTRSKKNYLLGFELWEVMTAFTIALTIASSLMWFSNLQPRNIQSEFILQDQYKASLYNLWVKTKHLKSQGSALYLLPEAQECQAGFLEKEVKVVDAEDYIQQIESLKTESTMLQQNINEVDNFISPEVSLNDVGLNLNTYLQSFVNVQNDKLKLAGAVLISQQLITKSCQQGWALESNDLELLESNLVTAVNLSSSSDMLSLKDLKDLIIVKDEQESRVLTEAEVNLLADLSASLWSLEYLKLHSEASLLEQEDRLILSFKDYENWQQEFVSDNSFLASKTVYIFN